VVDIAVLLGAMALIALVLYWSGRFGKPGRSAGTSLRRGPSAHITTTGRPKVAYATRDEAETSARRLAGRDGVRMSAYRCSTCSKWHVGHEK
jgi:hypothetical protein